MVVEAKLLVGADGNQSAVREKLLGDGPPHFMGMAAWRAGAGQLGMLVGSSLLAVLLVRW